MTMSHFVIYSLVSSGAMAIRVLTMDDGVLPEHDVKAEILDTASIKQLDQLTICGRFLTPFRPTMINILQDIIFIKDMWLMFRFEMRSCERRFPGCTEYYKESLAQKGEKVFLKLLLSVTFQGIIHIGSPEILWDPFPSILLFSHFQFGNQTSGIHFVFCQMLQTKYTGHMLMMLLSSVLKTIKEHIS